MTDLDVFVSPEQLEGDMSNQVLLEEAAVASILHKSLVHFELKLRHHDFIYQHPQHCHCHYQQFDHLKRFLQLLRWNSIEG